MMVSKNPPSLLNLLRETFLAGRKDAKSCVKYKTGHCNANRSRDQIEHLNTYLLKTFIATANCFKFLAKSCALIYETFCKAYINLAVEKHFVGPRVFGYLSKKLQTLYKERRSLLKGADCPLATLGNNQSNAETLAGY